MNQPRVIRPPQWDDSSRENDPSKNARWHKLPVWGRVGTEAFEKHSENLEKDSRDVALSRGLGRSYGDASLPPESHAAVLNTTLSDRILSWDEDTGILRAEAGLSLYNLNQIFLPRRWFVPVTPGTQFVTLGGMVASDVHGKNHHVAGCFGEHVTSLKIRTAEDKIVEATPQENRDLFWATIGGMGLTGHILEVEFRMEKIPSMWIWQEVEQIANIDKFLTALKTGAKDWPMTVGWIDTLSTGNKMGRGILIKGRWATADEAPKRIARPKKRLTFPVELPGWVLNPWTVRAFNSVYYHKQIKPVMSGIVHPETFFYPLDFVRHWNRIYGPRGFTQYQCVIPASRGTEGVRRFLELLTNLGGTSFLSIIKDCGPEGNGTLSFPMEGTSIASDIPIRDDTQYIVDRLNEYVIKQGGRIYLTKDTMTRPEHFRSMEPRLDDFQKIRETWDPHGKLRSAQSVRILGDKA